MDRGYQADTILHTKVQSQHNVYDITYDIVYDIVYNIVYCVPVRCGQARLAVLILEY